MLPSLRFGPVELANGAPELGRLRSSTELLSDASALRARLDEDGYLLLRGFHDRGLVQLARTQMLEKLRHAGALDPSAPLSAGRIRSGATGAFRGGRNELTTVPAFQEVVRGPRVLDFFSQLRGGPAMTFDYQWLRVVGRGEYTGAHYDIVYMGRGTHQLLTMWTPVGNVPLSHGPLAICVGSHRAPEFQRIRETYGKMDVDRDQMKGWFDDDPMAIQRRYGGTWSTTEFEAGDVLIFGMFTLHASLTNVSDEFRLSSDTRYQLASEPYDDRWVGPAPKAHYAWHLPGTEVKDKRAEWGV